MVEEIIIRGDSYANVPVQAFLHCSVIVEDIFPVMCSFFFGEIRMYELSKEPGKAG
jgi:hypothetical protein